MLRVTLKRFGSILPAMVLGLALPMGAACNDQGRADPRITQIQELQDKAAAQARRIVEKDEAILAQAARIRELQNLEGARSIENLIHVTRIELAPLSGGYDDDGDSVDEGVVAYVRLLDQDGDVIKATGGVRVRLIDLSNPEGQQLVGGLALDAAGLKPLWFGRLLTSHYTIKVPWADGAKRAEHKSITVHVTFTDLLSGEVFETQKAVEVRGAMPSQ
ncbi:MAG: hypothetical protein ABII12_17475 [Planctomycetota bacterium]